MHTTVFRLDAKRTGQVSGYNSHQFPLTAEVQNEIDALLSADNLLRNVPFSSINLYLQFTDYFGKPEIHYIDEDGFVLYVEAAVDWRERIKNNKTELKSFFLSSAAECLLWVWHEYGLPDNRLAAAFRESAICPSETIRSGEKLRDYVIEAFNELEIGIKLSKDEMGNEKEIEACQNLALELDKFGSVSTLCGGGFYCISVECDQPMQVLRKIKPMLLKKKLLAGSYTEEKRLVNGYFKHNRCSLP